MLYFLLIIIAVGVLLLSQEGKEILDLLTVLILTVAAVYTGYWIIVFLLGLFSDINIKGPFVTTVGAIFLAFLVYDFIYKLYKKHKEGKISIEILRGRFVTWVSKNKKMTIFLVLSVCLTIFTLLISGALVLIN